MNECWLCEAPLDADEVQRAVSAAEGDAQAAWNRVLKAYLDGDISLGRAAQLLELSRFDLLERMVPTAISHGDMDVGDHIAAVLSNKRRTELKRGIDAACHATSEIKSYYGR